MATKTGKMAIEYLSDIGKAGFELQRFTDAELVEAMKFMRVVNPELFTFIGNVIAANHPSDISRGLKP